MVTVQCVDAVGNIRDVSLFTRVMVVGKNCRMLGNDGVSIVTVIVKQEVAVIIEGRNLVIGDHLVGPGFEIKFVVGNAGVPIDIRGQDNVGQRIIF